MLCCECGGPIEPEERYVGLSPFWHWECSDAARGLDEAYPPLPDVSVAGVELPIPAPEGLKYHDYQLDGIRYMLAHLTAHGGVIVADDMGLGKTIQTIGVVNTDPSIRTVLVVCPLSVKPNWRSEWAKWRVRSGVDFQFTTYESAKKMSAKDNWDLLIVDEAHRCKNVSRKTDQTRAVEALAKRARLRILLSGTPNTGRPADLWPLLRMANPQVWDDTRAVKMGLGRGWMFTTYLGKFCEGHAGGVALESLAELGRALRASCVLRRHKRDVLGLPDPAIERVELGMPDQEVLAPIRDSDLLTASGKLRMKEIARAWVVSELAKVPQVAAHVRTVLRATSKVVIFGHHEAALEHLEVELAEFKAVLLNGKTKEGDRKAAIKAFQTDDECRVFIGSIGAAKEGITLTRAHHVVFATGAWRPSDIEQAYCRCHRYRNDGPQRVVTVQRLVLDTAIDDKMQEIELKKSKIVAAMWGDIVLSPDDILELSRTASTGGDDCDDDDDGE